MKDNKNTIQKIRELKKLSLLSKGTDKYKKELVKEVKKISRQVNQRLYRLEKANVGINDTAYRYAQYETGKQKPRYPTGEQKLFGMSVEDIYTMALQINDKLESETSTIRGVKRVINRRLESAVSFINSELDVKKEVSIEDFKQFLIDGGGQLLNSKYLDSEQIIEDWQASNINGITTDEFLKEFRRYKEIKSDTYSKVRRNLKKLRSN